MKKLFLLLASALCLSAHAANPSFTTFDTTSFLVDQPNNSIKGMWRTNAADGTITNINAFLGVTVNGNVTVTNLVDAQIQIMGSNASTWVLKAVADTNSSTKAWTYSDGKGEHFVVTRNGNLSKVLDVTYTWPGTNGTAGQVFTTDGNTPQQIYYTEGSTTANFTNEIRSIVTNAGGIGPGTVNQVAKFVTANNVGNSIVSETATNQWEWRSRASPTAWTNNVTNTIYGRDNGAGSWDRLSIVAVSGLGSGVNEIFGETTLSGANGNAPLFLHKAWQINHGTQTSSGNTAGYLLPGVSDAYNIGTSSSRVKSVTTGAGGFHALDAPTVNASDANFAAATYSINMWGTGIWMENNSAGFLTGFARDATLGVSGTYLGPNVLGAGSSTTTLTWDTFLSRGNEAHTWIFSTNSGAAAFASNAVLEGSEGSGTDKSGGAIEILGGRSTGIGTNGPILLSTALQANTTSSSLNTRQIREYICADRIKLTTNSATLVMNYTLPTALKSVGMRVFATTTIEDGVDIATVTESFIVAAVRKGTTVTTSVSAPTPTVTLVTGAAGLTTTWTAVANAQSVDLKCNAVTSGITSTNSSTMFRAEFDSGAAPTIVQAQ